MKVSIITVCYNSEATIREAIESVLSQTYTDIEYIIVDGASSDSTLSIVDEYQRKIAKVISEEDSGLYDAMNKGVLAATGEVLGILNSDDVYSGNAVISDIVQSFIENQYSDLVFGDVVFVKPNNLDTVVRYYRSRYFKSWKLRFGWMPPHPATFIRKSVYSSVGLYALDYEISADFELFVRMLLLRRLKYYRLDKTLVKMRFGGVSSSGLLNIIRLNFEIVRACRRNGVYTNIFFLLGKIPFKLVELIRKPKNLVV